MKVYLLALAIILLAGCDHVDSKVYEVKTTNGETIKFLCPKIDPHRSSMTYMFDSYCVLVTE